MQPFPHYFIKGDTVSKIALMMIVRNEGKHLRQCLDSIAPYVDGIFIGLAGKSTDDTEQIARAYAAQVSNLEWTNNFSESRNKILNEVRETGEYTHALWLDGDDEFIGGDKLHEAVDKFPQMAGFLLKYEYWRDDNGEAVQMLVRERIFNLDYDWTWKNRIHEICTTTTEAPRIAFDKMYVKHHGQDKERNFDRNYDLLLEQLADEEPTPTRSLLAYLGNEEAMRNNHAKAITYFTRAIASGPENDESYQCQHKIADSLRAMGELDRAMVADFKAIQMKVDWPDAYYGLAETSFAKGDWAAVCTWTAQGNMFAPPNTTLVVNPQDYTSNPLLVLAIAQSNLGQLSEALENFKQAREVRPTPALDEQIFVLSEEIAKQQLLKSFLSLLEHLGRNDEWLKARSIFSYIPKVLEDHPLVLAAMRDTYMSTAHVEDPSLMDDHYVNNPGWAPMSEDVIFSRNWLDHPRMKYAIDVAKNIEAHHVLDIGSSDGFISLPVARETGAKVDGLDLDPRCVDLANERAEKLGLSAKFYQGNFGVIDEWSACEKFYKYDLGIFFEAIEHVVDPKATLDTLDRACSHVALTTPHLAWENGQLPEWNRVELKGHLRIFDLRDIEMLLAPRGRIYNLYREPWGNTGWIFADYEVGATTVGSVEIVCPPSLERWGPVKYHAEGLGGSETAVIKLAEELSNLDHMVTVYNNIDSPGYFNKVRYRDNSNYASSVKTNLSIAWRSPELADDRPNTDRFVLWMHDTDAGDRLTPDRASQFDHIVVLSEWHKQHMLQLYPFIPKHKFVVIGNGVDLSRFSLWQEAGPIWESEERDSKVVVYSSSPDRGLDLILKHVWPRVVAAVPDAELHYFYGWNNFEALAGSFPHLEAFQRSVSDAQLQTKNVVSHGRVSQAALSSHLMRASIWLYPTYFAETYCITAIECQLAGLVPVTNKLAALNETVQSGIFIDGNVYEGEVLDKYADAVIELLKFPPSWDKRISISDKAPAKTWTEIAADWNQFLN